MPSVLVKHTVEDYDSWKAHFDDHQPTREEFGQLGYQLYSVTEDPNEVVVLLYWDSVENARRFFEESDVADVMDRAGVIGEPELHFLDEIEAKRPGAA